MAAAGFAGGVAGSWAHKQAAPAASSATAQFLLIIMILAGTLVIKWSKMFSELRYKLVARIR
jgi:hypothetical protein